MKKLIFLFLFFAARIDTSAQDPSQLQDYAKIACSCLYKAATNHANAADFNNQFSGCLDQYIKNAQESDKTINTPEKLKALVSNVLKANCRQFDFIDSVYRYYSVTTKPDSNAEPEDCKLLKVGDFITDGEKSGALIQMMDSIQLIRFKSGAYTKSKVIWSGPCSYKIIRIESTDPYEQAMMKPGEEREIQIIEVEENTIFTYQLVMGNGKIFTGKLKRIR